MYKYSMYYLKKNKRKKTNFHIKENKGKQIGAHQADWNNRVSEVEEKNYSLSLRNTIPSHIH